MSAMVRGQLCGVTSGFWGWHSGHQARAPSNFTWPSGQSCWLYYFCFLGGQDLMELRLAPNSLGGTTFTLFPKNEDGYKRVWRHP